MSTEKNGTRVYFDCGGIKGWTGIVTGADPDGERAVVRTLSPHCTTLWPRWAELRERTS